MRLFGIVSVLFLAAVGVFAIPVVERQTTQSVANILTDLSDTVAPLAQKMRYTTSENATEANLTPVITEITTAVTDTVSKLQILKGQSSTMTRSSVDDTSLGADDIASLLASIITLIFQAASAVLSVVDSSAESIIFGLLSELGKLVLNLLPVTLFLVTGLVGPLITLLDPVLSIITSLGLGSSLLGALLGGLI